VQDEEVNMHKGRNYPIMNIQERVLGLLSCRFVDEVVIGAPWEITSDMITTFNISSAPNPPLFKLLCPLESIGGLLAWIIQL
jgi:glycerol-3-phosphate cytidylyltransferase-like family protein